MNLMDKLRAVESIQTNYKGFDDLIYNHPSFQVINNDLPQKHYYLVFGEVVLAHFCCSIQEGVAHSHIRAPFGGFYFDDSASSEAQLFFIIEVERRLKELGVDKIVIDQAPENLLASRVSESLLLLGYQLVQEREYQMIGLSNEPFAKGLHEMEKRKLKKAKELGFQVDFLEEGHLKSLFDFIFDQRLEKGYDFSIEWSVLKEFKREFPENYIGVAVRHKGEWVAGTLLIRENHRSVYSFAPAHAMKYNRYSPVVMMTEAIYTACYKNKNGGGELHAKGKKKCLFFCRRPLLAPTWLLSNRPSQEESLTKVYSSLCVIYFSLTPQPDTSSVPGKR